MLADLFSRIAHLADGIATARSAAGS